MTGLCCLILGMHRSGTSCLARILHRAGLTMGDDLMLEPEMGNLIGHWESTGAVQINDRILARSRGQWDRIPANLLVENEDHAAIDLFLKRFANLPAFGWKDPRMTITFPIWRPHLGNYRVLACFRHPYAVAQSLQKRDGIPFDAGVELWAVYNERLLAICADEPEVFWFPYDGVGESYWETVEAFCQCAGLQFSPELLQLYNPCLTHYRGDNEIAESRIRALHARLIELAEKSRANRPALPLTAYNSIDATSESAGSQSIAASTSVDRNPERLLADMDARLAQMSEAMKCEYLVHHRDHKAVLGLLRTTERLEHEIAEFRNREDATKQMMATLEKTVSACRCEIDRLTASNAVLSDTVRAIDQWVVLRVYRSLMGVVRGRSAQMPAAPDADDSVQHLRTALGKQGDNQSQNHLTVKRVA